MLFQHSKGPWPAFCASTRHTVPPRVSVIVTMPLPSNLPALDSCSISVTMTITLYFAQLTAILAVLCLTCLRSMSYRSACVRMLVQMLPVAQPAILHFLLPFSASAFLPGVFLYSARILNWFPCSSRFLWTPGRSVLSWQPFLGYILSCDTPAACPLSDSRAQEVM